MELSKKVQLNIGILGASGYTGVELVRLLTLHPNAKIKFMTANSHAGKNYNEVFPHLGNNNLPKLIKTEDIIWDDIDVVFCALPHGTTQEIVKTIPTSIKIIDLSADFRLDNIETYAEWYGHKHHAPEIQKEAVYGLTEFNREEVSKARVIACPGCYPTASLLQILPLLKDELINVEDIIIDAKSGVTGAGRSLKEASLFSEVAEGMHPYGIANHRHAPEIEQEIEKIIKKEIKINFTPHLVPMNRGELITSYLRLSDGVTSEDLINTLRNTFSSESFVRVSSGNVIPATRHVRGSNFVITSVFPDRIPGRVILVTVIDNLVKGSSGQAIQNMNLMFGISEETGLEQQPLFP
jgi:N-acetyl-gamma-glutamyl-phosphate reductase